ncbi:MAG: HAD-IC family P-type ATPase [Silvanigrellaceae bacterium]
MARETELIFPRKIRNEQCHPAGLNSAEAEKRLAEYGINSIERRKKENPILIFSRELSNLLAIVLWITAVVVFSIAFIYAQKDMYPLGFAIIGVVLINAFFSFWQSLKAERAMEALQNILPVKSLVIRSSNWLSIAAETLVPGDIISLREGDTAAADIRLLESHSLRVDTSHITGESLPSFRHSEPDKSDDIFQARNVVLAGVRVVSGRAQGVVFATGTRSEFGKMAGLTLASEKKPSPLQHEIALVSKRVALFSIALGVGFALLGVISGLPFNQALLLGAAMIVANIPEGLMPTITLSLAFAAQRMSKRNALVRHLPAVEALGSTTVICTDKTGTLTLNQLKVKEIDWLAQTVDAGQFIAKKDFTAGENALLARQAATATLVSVVLMQIANVFLCRQQPFSVRNNLIYLGVALEIVFIAAVMFFAPLQRILNTAQVTWRLFPVVFCFMGLMILGEKLRRKVISKKLKLSPDSLAPRCGE